MIIPAQSMSPPLTRVMEPLGDSPNMIKSVGVYTKGCTGQHKSKEVYYVWVVTLSNIEAPLELALPSSHPHSLSRNC